ncbi:MAG: DNA repair protein RecO [Ignavibacteriales bacterium]|nr:DNA repair protein RecO [Ignavibacteriales bacterium]
MSVIEKTEAIVLRSVDFRESSKIVTFYTKKFGKIAGIVKGAKQTKNKFGSSLEPMSYVSLVFYFKEGRDVQTVSSCDIVKPFRKLFDDIDKMTVGMGIIELLNNVTLDRHENIQLFTHVVNSLNSINSATKNAKNLFFYFEYHLARLLGFGLQFDHCVQCDKILSHVVDGNRYHYSIDRGGLICSKCSGMTGTQFEISSELLKIFREIFSSNNIDLIIETEIASVNGEMIQNFLWTYLQYHLPNLHSLKTLTVLGKIV